MDELQSMRVFVRVAQGPGFAKAARDLRLSPSAVTKHVAALESRVGVRLLDRTTRRVSTTEAGRIYLERCLEALQAVEDAGASVGELLHEASGVLRITAPVDLAAQLGGVVGRFMEAHPRVVVDLRLSNRTVDLVDEGIDLALRVAGALEGQFVARPVGQVRAILCASPSYLAKHGRPRRPEDLAGHRTIIFAEPRPYDELVLERAGKRKRVRLKVAMLANSGEATRAAMLADAGIGTMPSFLAGDDFITGRLEEVLPGWTYRGGLKLFALYPHRRFLAAKVRLFVDALRAEFGDGTTDPWWRPGRAR